MKTHFGFDSVHHQITFASGLAFPSIADKPLNTVVNSSPTQVLGITVAVNTSISSASGNGQYRIGSDANFTTTLKAWGNTTGTIANGNYLQIRLTTNNANFSARSLTMNVGTTSIKWTARTIKADVATILGSSPWTVPSDWNNQSNYVECTAGGGGGGGGYFGSFFQIPPVSYGYGGGGGGGGAYVLKNNINLTRGSSVNFQVGGGGTAGAGQGGAGGGGGDSWFQSSGTVLAKSGAGGTEPTGGLGGNDGCVGDVITPGNDGASSAQNAAGAQGGAGAGPYGGGGGSGGSTAGTTGSPGNNYGGAGGGGGWGDSGVAGGQGAIGRVIATYTPVTFCAGTYSKTANKNTFHGGGTIYRANFVRKEANDAIHATGNVVSVIYGPYTDTITTSPYTVSQHYYAPGSYVECWGAGGTGGTGQAYTGSATWGGSGGGGGGYARKNAPACNGGDSVTCTFGTYAFGSYCAATSGGTGGLGAASPAGSGTIGDVLLSGGAGAPGAATYNGLIGWVPTGVGGAGGAGANGAGGGGVGGRGASYGQGATAGGAGGAGRIIFTYYTLGPGP